jgi:S1-C subfamily serine protease
MLEEFESTGRISRPTLGVGVLYVSDDLAEALRLPRSGSLLVQSVEEGSPAEAAGLRGANRTVIINDAYQIRVGGDLIIAVDGKPVENKDALQFALNRKRGGDPLTLSVLRNGRTVRINVTLGEARVL